MHCVLSSILAASLGIGAFGSQAEPPKTAVKPAPSPSPPPVLEGTVKGPDGRPIEKALVVARAANAHWTDVPATARTDSRGAFRLTLKRPRLYNVRVEAKGLAARTVERVAPGRPLTITLQKGRFVEGTVRDAATGNRVAGARVEASEHGTVSLASDPTAGVIGAVTDKQGRYRLDGLRDALHVVSVVARGYGRAVKSGVAPGRIVPLYLLPGVSLNGTVWGPGKKPVAGAIVQAEPELSGQGAVRPEVSDDQGRFEVLGLAPGLYRLVVRHKDYAPGVVWGVPVEGSSDTRSDVLLERAVPLVGRLLGPDPEKTVAGHVKVAAIDGKLPPPSLSDMLGAETGGDGRFRLDVLPPGDHVLAVEARGYTSRRVEVSVGVGAPRADAGDILLDFGAAIRGKVKQETGQAIADALIEASARRPPSSLEFRSGPDGSFAVTGLEPGPYYLKVSAPGFVRIYRPVEAGAEDVEVVLSSAGTITGLVVDENDRPVEAFRVRARSAAREGQGSQRSAEAQTTAHAEGRFTLEGIAEGTYVVEVAAPEHGDATASEVKVTPGATTDAGRIRLDSGGTVKGDVVDTSGSSIAGASVTVQRRSQQRFVQSDFGGLQAESDMGGAFEIHGVPAGTVNVTARHPSFAEGAAARVEIDPAKGPAEVRIVLSPGGRIEGAVRKRDGTGLSGIVMELMPRDESGLSPDRTMAVTHGDGSFAFEHVPTGRGRVSLISVSAGQHAKTQEKQVDVREGETSTLDFVLREILVSGRVTRSGAPASNLRVRFHSYTAGGGTGSSFGYEPSEPQRMTGITREDGSYALIMDTPGKANVSIESLDGGIGFSSRLVTIPDVDAYTVDLSLSGIPVSGIVVEKDTDVPIAQAMIMVLPGAPTTPSLSGADGRFRLELEPGEYKIAAIAEGHRMVEIPVTVDPGGTPEVRFVLSRGLSISGKVVDPAGLGVGGVQVVARGGGGEGALPQSAGLSQTLPDGSFQIDGLASELHMLTAFSDGGSFGTRSDVAAGAKDVVLSLRPGGKIRLQVTGPDGSPVQGASARAIRVDGISLPPWGEASRTDALGIVELVAPAGSVEVWVRQGALDGRATVSVASGAMAEAAVKLAGLPPTGAP
jgi:hypothetical protein